MLRLIVDREECVCATIRSMLGSAPRRSPIILRRTHQTILSMGVRVFESKSISGIFTLYPSTPSVSVLGYSYFFLSESLSCILFFLVVVLVGVVGDVRESSLIVLDDLVPIVRMRFKGSSVAPKAFQRQI